MRIARHHDAVFIHFQSGWLIHSRCHFDWSAAILIPSSQSGPIAKVIQERTTTVGLLVEPGIRLLACNLLSGFLVLVRPMPQRSTISSEMPNVQNLSYLT